MRLSLILFLCLFWQLQSIGQPVDNPYRTKYNPALSHWTDSLPWKQVVNITAVQGSNWDEKLENAQRLVVTMGGGVVFFPAGTYGFLNPIIIKDKVILRGEKPLVDNGTDPAFAPPSRIVFPAYVPTLAGEGTPNNTAFRYIRSSYFASNTGMVHLDVNRAYLQFQPLAAKCVASAGGGVLPCKQSVKRNVIVFGIRNNNAALPTPNIPYRDQNQWQRYNLRYLSNLDVLVDENAAICNNRFNDFTANTTYPISDESYAQPNYLVYDDSNNLAPVADSSHATFDYSAHYGLTVNRFLTNFDYIDGKITGSFGDITLIESTPNRGLEKLLFAKGIEIQDNYIYNTIRVSMFVAGQGMVIRNNVLRNKPGKQAWISSVGTSKISYQAYLENRGIDFTGYNILIENNDVEVWNHQFENSNYRSNDGEGIMIQECCGGTENYGYTIRNNKVTGPNAYIGLFKTKDIHRVNITGNDLGGKQIYVNANTNTMKYSLLDVLIENNINVGGMVVTGSAGGRNCEVRNNTGSGDIIYSCYVKLSDNKGFSFQPCTPTDTVIPQDSIRFTVDGITYAYPNPEYPKWACRQKNPFPDLDIFPGKDTIVVDDTARALQTPVVLAQGKLDSIYVYRDTDLVGRVKGDAAMVTIPLASNGNYFIKLKGFDVCGAITYSHPVTVVKNTPFLTGLHKNSVKHLLRVYPNPTRATLFVEPASSVVTFSLTDLSGKYILKDQPFALPINIDFLASGTYVLQLQTKAGIINQLVVKQ